jgi:hypothetical protein
MYGKYPSGIDAMDWELQLNVCSAVVTGGCNAPHAKPETLVDVSWAPDDD